MYINKKANRSKIKLRSKIKKQNKHRLTVYKSNKHIYAQLYNYNGTILIASASTLDKLFKDKLNAMTDLSKKNKIEKAKLVGALIAKKITSKKITNVVFDRSGFKFHGRIKALAEAVNKFGINC